MKIKKPISPYTYVGIMYDEIKKEINFNEKTGTKKKIISNFTIKEILSIVANQWGVTEDEIIGKTRKQTYVDARYTFFAALKLKYDMDLDTIGQHTNKRHHTTVIHGLRSFYNRYHGIDNFRRVSDNVFLILGMEYVGEKLTQSIEPFESKKRKRLC